MATLILFVLLIRTAYMLVIFLLRDDGVGNSSTFSGLVTLFFVLTAYLFSRTRWYETAVFVVAVGFAWNMINLLHTFPNSMVLSIFLIVPVMLSSMVVSIKKTAVVALIEATVFLYCIVTNQNQPGFWGNMAIFISLYLIFTGLILLSMRHRHQIEQTRRSDRLQQSQNQLVEKEGSELEARKRQAIAETLQAAIAVLNSSLSLEEVLSQILVQLENAIPYDSAAIQQKEGNHLILKAARGFDDNAALIDLSFPLEANLPNAQVVRTQKPQALDNVTEAYPEFHEIASTYQAEKICAWLGVPLIAEGTVIGMITIDRYEKRPFTPDEIALATTFANYASMALHNAALYRELENHSEALEKAVAARMVDLQRSNNQVRTILNNSPDAILFLNTDQTIEQCNSAFLHFFEYKNDEAVGLLFLQFVINSEQENFKQIWETVVSTITPQRIDTTVQNKNDRFIEVNATLAPIQENGILTGIVCSLHDISHFKEVERLKDTFVSNVSHELRTPITNLRLHHDLLYLNPKKQAVYLDRLDREINRLTTIIEDLLRISRLDQKRIELTLTAVNLTSLAEQHLNDRTTLAETKQIKLSLATEPVLPAVQADTQLLEQVISILLTNAMNYSPPGGQINLTPILKQADGQQWAGLRLSDTGPGIPENEQSQIFTRFFRGHSALDSGEPGTGLGLAIAQEIMRLHHGHVELESTSKEGGTSFIIWLPASAPPE